MSISSVVRGLVEVPISGEDGAEGVAGVAADWSSVASLGWEASSVGVVGGVVERLVMSERVVEHSGISLSLSFWLSLHSSDRVGQIAVTGSIPVGLVGSNGGVVGKSGLIAGVAEVGRVTGGQWASVASQGGGVAVGGVGGLVEAVVAIGAVEHSGVSLGLSSSEGSATDLRGENMKRRKSRIVILPQ